PLGSRGAEPTLWRTPWGDLASWSRGLAASKGLRIVGWTVDTHDWRGDAAAEMFARARERLQDGAVVLAHDGIGPGARRSHVCETIGLVRLIADHAREHGLGLQALA